MPISSDILERIKNNDAKLRQLDLSNQNLNDDDIAKLVQALSNNSYLISLNLRNNQITNEGAKLLASVNLLKSLRLYNGNKITTQGLIPFLQNSTLISFPIQGGSGPVIDQLRKKIEQNITTNMSINSPLSRTPLTLIPITTNPQQESPDTYISLSTTLSKPKILPSNLAEKLKTEIKTQPTNSDCSHPSDKENNADQKQSLRSIAYDKKKSPKKERKEGDPFENNITAALALPSEYCNVIGNDRAEKINQQVQLSKAQIVEHAARRIDFAFYTFIAYYQSQLTVELGNTNLQYGVGSRSIPDLPTDGSHSALITSFLDTTLTLEKEHNLRSGNVIQKKYSQLDETFFRKSLNATVEIPQGINISLDKKLEGGKFDDPSPERSFYLELINRVSKNELAPLDALHQFLKKMETFFTDIKNSKFVKDGAKRKNSPAKSRASSIEFEEEGSFKNCWLRHPNMNGERRIHDDYIHMLLRLSPDEIHLTYRSEEHRNKIYHHAYLKIQAEIFGRSFNEKLQWSKEDLEYLQQCKTPPKSIAESLQFFNARKKEQASNKQDSTVTIKSSKQELQF